MKVTKFASLCLGILLLSLPLGVSAQEDSLVNHPGYLNLDEIIDNNQNYITSEVYLQNYILKMIAKLTKRSEPDFSKMLSSIELIRVIEMDFKDMQDAKSRNQAQKLVDYLNSNKWDTLVRSRDEHSNVNICIQSDREDHIYALAIVNWEEDSLSVVNVVGDIDLELLARLGEQFDIDSLEDFDEVSDEG
ncbi:MAG: DUF4252 domain-containing protein [Opitutales bacterium]|nr:DUF4252 domain-containing protein [Opitutales bacterium]